MTRTYSETRQRAYFAAAAEMYKLVVLIADENIDNPPEGEAVTQANITWATSLIETTFKKGLALEDQGHEEGVASPRQETRLYRLRMSALARTSEGRRLDNEIIAKLTGESA